MFFNILDLSNYDPKKDIVIVHVPIGKMPPHKATKFVRDYAEPIKKMLEERGFDSMVIGIREEHIPYLPKNQLNMISKEQLQNVNKSITDGPVKLGLSPDGFGEVDGKTAKDRAHNWVATHKKLRELGVVLEDDYDTAMKIVE